MRFVWFNFARLLKETSPGIEVMRSHERLGLTASGKRGKMQIIVLVRWGGGRRVVEMFFKMRHKRHLTMVRRRYFTVKESMKRRKDARNVLYPALKDLLKNIYLGASSPLSPELILSCEPFRVKLNIFPQLSWSCFRRRRIFMNKFYYWKFQLKEFLVEPYWGCKCS